MTGIRRRIRGLIRRALREPAAPPPDQQVVDLLRDVRWELREQRKYHDLVRIWAARDTYAELREFTRARQLGFEDTMRAVVRDRLSLARFGDGELNIMLRPEFKLRFQPWSAGLAEDLRGVLRMDGYDPLRVLVGFPYTFRNVHWASVWLDIWPEVQEMLHESVMYGMAHVSRPQYFLTLGQRGVHLWRDVWDGQHIVVVTGEGSRFYLEPALFDNAKTVEHVYSTPTDAYADLPRLMPLLEAADPDKLFLIALGPAGTVAAARLSRLGRWAIDVGHISESYANVFKGGKWPEDLAVARKK
jgi:hypothetical protein